MVWRCSDGVHYGAVYHYTCYLVRGVASSELTLKYSPLVMWRYILDQEVRVPTLVRNVCFTFSVSFEPRVHINTTNCYGKLTKCRGVTLAERHPVPSRPVRRCAGHFSPRTHSTLA